MSLVDDEEVDQRLSLGILLHKPSKPLPGTGPFFELVVPTSWWANALDATDSREAGRMGLGVSLL